MAGEINIFGQILNDQDAQAYGGFSSKMMAQQLKDNQDESEIVVNITSPGGLVSEGFAIHDMLKNSGKKIITKGTGIVASIATVIFLAGDERLLSENAEFMIHNSRVFPFSPEGMEAKDLENLTSEAKRIEARIRDFYSNKLNKGSKIIGEYMDVEKTFTTSEAISLGFATGIMKPEDKLKAVAFYRPKTENMDKQDHKIVAAVKEAVKSLFKSENIKAEMQAGQAPVSERMVWELSDGGQVEIETTEGGAVIGGRAFMLDETGKRDEQAIQDATLRTEGGDTVTIEGGRITSVSNPDSEAFIEEEIEEKEKFEDSASFEEEEEEKKFEIRAIEKLEAKNEELEKQVKALKESLESVPNLIASSMAEGISEIKAVIDSGEAPASNVRRQATAKMSGIKQRQMEMAENRKTKQ